MSQTLGTITEYNPFHLGHLYHLQKSKEITACDRVITVMSGNFTQRGEPAFLDKWHRTSMALQNGVDLVIELPTVYSIRSAEMFSHGATSILHHTGLVDSICFGSELGDVDYLHSIAKILANEPQEFKSLLQQEIKSGLPFSVARQKALQKFLGHTSIKVDDSLGFSNNILGIEYLKALIRNNSTIKPYTLSRIGSHYNDKNITHSIASATGIRTTYFEEGNIKAIDSLVPTPSLQILLQYLESGFIFSTWEQYYPYLRYLLSTNTAEQLEKVPEVIEGLQFKILEEFKKTSTIEDLITGIKSKRYPYTRIQRILLYILLQIQKEDFQDFDIHTPPPYIRVLGFNNHGRALLKEMKKHASIPIITKTSDFYQKCTPHQRRALDLELRSSNIYYLPQNNKNLYHTDFTHSPIYLKNI